MQKVGTLGNDVIISRYRGIRKQTEVICQPLLAEDYVVQPVEDVSPPKWHLGHTSWFFETFILRRFHRKYQAFDPAYNYVFNSYYESIGDRLLRTQRGNMTRPSIDQIYQYRSYVDKHMLELLDGKLNLELITLLDLGLQHEQQHQELLLTDIKYILGHNPLFPVYKEREVEYTGRKPADIQFTEIPEGIYEIGYDNGGFCFDNEKPVHKRYVQGFRIMNRLITNGEYQQFMDDGGYNNFAFWLADGWNMVQKQGIKAPFYWMRKEGTWHEYTLGGLKKIDPLAPVTHISFYEAEAFANWAGKRLLTEFEWEVAAKFLKAENSKGNFLEAGIYHPVPVAGNSYQLLGDAWEWTYSAYHPYPGYKREEGALGEYNGKFMIGQIILRGGSCATPKDHIRLTYRNFFQPEKRWQFTGIRLGENI
ncbi:MAG: ergothioneine biosynthesis protein EgtB [Cytophagaceae bacterium]